MGLKPMGTDSEPKQRCGSSSRMTAGLILMPYEHPLMPAALSPTTVKVIGHA